MKGLPQNTCKGSIYEGNNLVGCEVCWDDKSGWCTFMYPAVCLLQFDTACEWSIPVLIALCTLL